MSGADGHVRSHLERFRSGDLTLETLESWLYANSASVQEALGPAIGLKLLEFDFRDKYASHELMKLIDRVYAERYPGELPIDQARRVATEYLNGARNLHSAMRVLASIRFDAPDDWIPDEIVYIDSELDNIPAPEQEPRWEPAIWSTLMSNSSPLMAEYERVAREVCTGLLTKPPMSRKREA